jgi:hypothetical protein
LAEIETRALYVPSGYSSLFTDCHEGLGYTEDAAYNRKVAAQVARRFPVVVDMLADGREQPPGPQRPAAAAAERSDRKRLR